MTNKELGASGTVEPPASDHPKYEDLVVAYHNQSKGASFQKRSRHICQRIIDAFCKLCILVVPCSHWSSLHALSGVVQCTNSKQSDHTMPQVDNYKRIKTMENDKTVRTKCGCAHLWQNYDKALSRKMVFWIGGCLREIVAHERWSHMEIWP